MYERVLIVDDDKNVRKSLAFALKDNYIIQTVENINEFINDVISFEPNIIISDICMPIKDGFDLCKELKDNNKNIPVIFITGFMDDDTIADVIGNDIAFLLFKPFNLDDLINKINFSIKNCPEGVNDSCLIYNLLSCTREAA